MLKIFIDPGHGGKDTGALGNGLQEKDITLSIALEMRRILQNEYKNVSVQLSRTSDTAVPLSERAAKANRWGADVYVSIHVNAGGGTGYEDYIYEGLSDHSTTARIRDIIHEEVIRATGFHDRGKKKADFYVLRETVMPAVLTENGFVDRKEDAEKLKDPAFLQKIARGHVNGLEKAFHLMKKSDSNDLIRVIVDGKQIGAYEKKENVLKQVEYYLGKANKIELERVKR
ncbi:MULTISPECIES: N-acetylmuramoyl-L-alanine amidase [unclassified Geobacillus]|uniref:N-acetylmuramoyl-L-alanine amidase family protein n=1 Tax=unclassified Geobacillus TaxID=2642459 RepID=UPI000BE33D4D|nr:MULTISPECIES: N-acetylmuramoyl-L-alanine amidase [unclassified Geobacillus]PDM39309.1 N-acetylmuramoyl-L-alanine amidase [Parageobacillus yumthangensis]RDV22302.1 N-acetylmuramoyl-L-alanine amidase [Parageobacillus toebii]TXK91742.1 N-acetylmuramoyl-L-alanine amidase [Parageobacillus sp. SY1]PUF88216.1 N-acetylmuramoyl-L-alanine amidase [Geobacillus sp. LYN3]TXK87801.1 N-acetylmuramoyl-L-alanine amidase [Geobacillus sp. AYS3]